VSDHTMRNARLHLTSLGLFLAFTVLASTVLPLPPAAVDASPSPDSYSYRFLVDEDGFTRVEVNYSSPGAGSSWVFVPKFSNWTYAVLSGDLVERENLTTGAVAGEDYYFYQAFRFRFKSEGTFLMTARFNLTLGAVVIEPRGVFYSPQIGFKEASHASAEVFLPEGDTIDGRRALAVGRASYGPTRLEGNYALFDLQENLVRLQVEFSRSGKPEMRTLERGIFTFHAVERYVDLAGELLDLYDGVYNSTVELFNVTLPSVDVEFFIPDFDSILTVGGYVPFAGGRVGDIHLNLFVERFAEGTLEVVALHELVHHFLSQARISPGSLLWFHEGMAQYVSVEVVDALGYEGAKTERESLEEAASGLIKRFYYLQYWSPESPPANMGTYYAASYYVISRLAEAYGGLDYYARFFKTIGDARISDDDVLAYHLSLAANASVARVLNGWGFNVADLYISSSLIEEARLAVGGLNPLFQPYKYLAGWLYRQGVASLEEGDARAGNLYLAAAIFLARWAPLLTVATVVAVVAAVVYVLRARRAKPKPVLPDATAVLEGFGKPDEVLVKPPKNGGRLGTIQVCGNGKLGEVSAISSRHQRTSNNLRS